MVGTGPTLNDVCKDAQDAWPQLCLLLARGPNEPLGAEEGAAAPGLVQRTQAAVLDCLLRCPSCSSTCAALSGAPGVPPLKTAM